jgi:GNAT superfamily N-acetyltransferase
VKPPVHIVRPYDAELDDPLVFDSWTKQMRRCMPASHWEYEELQKHRMVIARLLRECPVRVACHPEKHFVIYSYACAGLTLDGRQVIHMVFTRGDWRGRGLASELLNDVLPHFRSAPTFYTHNTRTVRKLERPWRLTFHPYLLQELV